MSDLCPTCGGPLDPTRLLVDMNTNTISFRGQVWHCRPTLIEFAFTLVQSYPKIVSDQELCLALWGLDGDQKGMMHLAVYACKLRQVIGQYVKVHRVNGRGYRLIIGSDICMQAVAA